MSEVTHGTRSGYFQRGCRCVLCKAEGSRVNKERRAARVARSLKDAPHGTPRGYAGWGCRCEGCRSAYSTSRKEYRERVRDAGLPPEDPRHGTVNGYTNLQCRCGKCSEVMSVQQKVNKARSRYGLTPEDVEDIYSGQGGVCAICKCDSGDLVVDHDHTTGEVRGVLCRNCNGGLGMLGDSVERLRAALAYLRTD